MGPGGPTLAPSSGPRASRGSSPGNDRERRSTSPSHRPKRARRAGDAEQRGLVSPRCDRRNDAGRQRRCGPQGSEPPAGLESSDDEEEREAVKGNRSPVGYPGQQQGVQYEKHGADDEAPQRAM